MVDNDIQKKIEIQTEAEKQHIRFKKKSTVAMSVGLGKSKLAINRILTYKKTDNILFSGYRQIYIDGFIKELKKFGHEDWIDHIDMCCTASLFNYDKDYDLFIYDESHLSPEMAAEFVEDQIRRNPNIEILCLTGTPGNIHNDPLLQLAPISYKKLTDDSVEEGLLNDYLIYIVKHDLLTENGSYQAKTYATSERKQYQWLWNRYQKSNSKLRVGKAIPFELVLIKQFFSRLKSKEIAAKQILNRLGDYKTLIYCGSIEQTNDFPYESYHSNLSKKERDENFSKFVNGEIKILTNVNGIRESVNVPDLKYGIIMKVDASNKGFEQAKGRFHRLSIEELSKIYVLVANNTIEEEWIEKATRNINKNKIFTINL